MSRLAINTTSCLLTCLHGRAATRARTPLNNGRCALLIRAEVKNIKKASNDLKSEVVQLLHRVASGRCSGAGVQLK